jgi:uncharacterized protein YndB with AHSA1/START domain
MNQETEDSAVARQGDCELAITRTFDAPPDAVFKAWSEADLFRNWWMPRSMTDVTLVACTMDVRTGGKYCLEFATDAPDTMAFHGQYVEIVPNERIVWTNDEDAAGAITTVTFENLGSKTLLTFHEAYPSREALEDALLGGAAALPEQLAQLGELLAGFTGYNGLGHSYQKSDPS